MRAMGFRRGIASAAALALVGVLALIVVACQPAHGLSSVIEREVAASREESVQTLPAAPSDLAATARSASRIDLSWADNSDNEEEFQIQRDSGSGFQGIASVGADSTAFSDSGLDPVTEYTYRIRATNSSGASEWTGGVSATTDAPPVQAPTAPSGLTATTQNADQIDLSWSDTSDNEEEFEIQRKAGVGGTYAQVATLSAGTTGYQDTGLDSQTTYYYRVRATNSAGSSNWSNEANDTTAQLAAPSGLTASAVSDSQIDLTWSDNSSFESGFEIERDNTVVDTVAADTTSYSDTGLSSGKEYTYRVRAIDPGGGSPWSNSNSATTLVYDIGDTGPAGGLIFYDDEDDGTDDIAGARYLEAAPDSTEWNDKVWGGFGTDINGDNTTVAPELDGIGAGASNTAAIVAEFGSTEPYEGKSDYAAKLADDLVHNGYSDWFLPSMDELDLMHLNLHQQGLGGFAADYYWSSSEGDSYFARGQHFGSGNQVSDGKLLTYRVRAVRAFGN